MKHTINKHLWLGLNIRLIIGLVICLLGMQACMQNEKTDIQSAELRNSKTANYDEKTLDLLALWIVGEWDNIKQVEDEIRQNIPKDERRQRFAMRYTEINTPHIHGRTFAIENYDDGNGFSGKMNRVSLHRFMLNKNNSGIIHEILFLKDKAFRKSLIGNIFKLESITDDDIYAREACRLFWHWTGERFEGKTKKGACVTSSYTDRPITVEGSGIFEANRFIRHDRNYEMTGEEIPRAGYESSDVFDRVMGSHLSKLK